MAFEEGLKLVCNVFKIETMKEFQVQAIREIVEGEKDVFVNMPTGCGKSLTYQALPLMFDSGRTTNERTNNSIILVVSPLVSLMTDQVSHLNSLGVKAICLSNPLTLEEETDLLAGKYSIVYGSPESWLMTKKWRSMIISEPYKNVRAVAVDEAHVIRHW